MVDTLTAWLRAKRHCDSSIVFLTSSVLFSVIFIFYVSMSFIFSCFKRATSFFQLLTQHSKSICIRSCAKLMSLTFVIAHYVKIKDLLFLKYAHTDFSLICSPIHTIMAPKMGSITDYNKRSHSFTYLTIARVVPLPSSNSSYCCTPCITSAEQKAIFTKTDVPGT